MNSSLSSSPFITGMGTYGAGGENVEALWKSTRDENIHATQEQFSENCFPVYRARLPDFSGRERAALRHADRTAHLALAAAKEAWANAHLEIGTISPERLGVVIGSARGPIALQEKYFSAPACIPSASLYTSFSSLAGLIARNFQAEGAAFMVSSSCTSGATALHAASAMIQSGLLDVVLVGGVESPLVESLLMQYQQTGIVSTVAEAQKALTPFAQGRSGTVLGEGAVFLVLESVVSAKKRKAPFQGCLEAISIATTSRHRAGLDPEGMALQKIIAQSLEAAALEADEIQLLHLHGTGTQLNDLLESRAVESFFGSRDQQPVAWATKAITGHTLGAAALFQVLLTLCALRHCIVPPIANCTRLDSSFSLNIPTPDTTLPASSKALSLTAGFWGNISSVILSVDELI